jgi:hypothetical protein
MWAPATGVIGGGALPTPKASDGERGRDKARGRPDTKGRELATAVRDQMLPTPRTCSAMAAPVNTQGNLQGNRFPNLETVIGRMLPTPTAALGVSGGSNCAGVRRPENLASAVKTTLAVPQVYQGQARKRMLPTPTTNDSKNASLPPSQSDRDGLAGAMLRDNSIPTGAATYLNPSFVEEMMGFPLFWTQLDD